MTSEQAAIRLQDILRATAALVTADRQRTHRSLARPWRRLEEDAAAFGAELQESVEWQARLRPLVALIWWHATAHAAAERAVFTGPVRIVTGERYRSVVAARLAAALPLIQDITADAGTIAGWFVPQGL